MQGTYLNDIRDGIQTLAVKARQDLQRVRQQLSDQVQKVSEHVEKSATQLAGMKEYDIDFDKKQTKLGQDCRSQRLHAECSPADASRAEKVGRRS